MQNELQGVLTITGKDGELVAVVFNNMKSRSMEFYSCKSMGMDDICELLNKYNEKI